MRTALGHRLFVRVGMTTAQLEPDERAALLAQLEGLSEGRELMATFDGFHVHVDVAQDQVRPLLFALGLLGMNGPLRPGLAALRELLDRELYGSGRAEQLADRLP